MRETLAQNSSPMAKPFFCQSKRLRHLGNIPTAHMLAFTSLAQIPPSCGPPSGSIAREALSMGPPGAPRFKQSLISLGSEGDRSLTPTPPRATTTSLAPACQLVEAVRRTRELRLAPASDP